MKIAPQTPSVFVIGSYVQACCWFVDRIPAPSETLSAHAFKKESGGKGLNVALGLHRLNCHVLGLFGVGQDDAGDQLITLLHQTNMDATFVYRLDESTGYGAGFIARDGQNSIAVFLGANLALNPTQVHNALQHTQLVYAQFEGAVSVIEASFKIARAEKIPTVLNPSPWQPIHKSLLDLTDIIIVNEVEASEFFSLHAVDLSVSVEQVIAIISPLIHTLMHTWQGRLLVVTLGRQGCVAFARNQTPLHSPAFLIEASDTVGAGDAFASGLCYGLLHAWDLEQSLRYADV